MATSAPAATTGGAEYGQPLQAAPAKATALLGGVVKLTGVVPGAQGGQPLTIERRDRRQGWVQVAQTTAFADGSFTAAWTADKIGRLTFRARPVTENAIAASAGPEIALTSVTIFREVTATWYGPGFYGRRTACGQKMSKKLQGVAHKTLKCGTKVDILFEGKTVTVPVVDRGPFRKGTAYDLTYATAQALDFTATARIGAASVR